jgi:EmrB/QacA subfamily drug resistance transporter
LWTAFAAIVLAMLPAVLDQTILATALPTIATDLGRLSDVPWVVTAYVVAAAAATPMWGKLGDRRGHQRMLECSLVLFLAASAVCGVAQSITMLVVSRVVQGAAAGGLMSLAMACVGNLVSPRERARYQGYIAATFAVATVAGPLLGGLLVEHASWRWVFYINLPVGIVAVAGLRLSLPAPAAGRHDQPLDLAGGGLLATATVAFMLACIWGGDRYAWTSPEILGLFAGATVLAAALVARERRAADPVVPFDLLGTRTVAVASVALFLTTASLFAINVFVPLYLQVTTGATPTEAGLLLVPMMIGITVSTNLAGRAISRTGRYKRYPLAGLALMSAAQALLAVMARHPSRAGVGVALAIFGLGFGMVGQVLITAVQNGVAPRRIGTAMAATSFFRGLGGAVGAAVLGAVFTARAGISAAATGSGTLGHGVHPGVVHGVIDGVQTVFIVSAPIAAIAFAVVLALPETPLRSGAGARPHGVGQDRGPTARPEFSRDPAGGLGDRGGELLGGAARHQPIGVTDDSDRTDGMTRVVEDRGGDARLAEDRLVLLARESALSDLTELLPQG